MPDSSKRRRKPVCIAISSYAPHTEPANTTTSNHGWRPSRIQSSSPPTRNKHAPANIVGNTTAGKANAKLLNPGNRLPLVRLINFTPVPSNTADDPQRLSATKAEQPVQISKPNETAISATKTQITKLRCDRSKSGVSTRAVVTNCDDNWTDSSTRTSNPPITITAARRMRSG